MSGSDAETLGSLTGWRSDPQTTRTFRYAVGSTLAMALAMGIDWRLSYLTPVLVLSFLGTPAPRPTVRTSLAFILVVGAASVAGIAFSALLLPYPELFLLLDGLILFLLFYAGARGAPAMLVALLLIAMTVIPVVALQAIPLALAVGKGLVWGAIGAITVVWLAHFLIPDAQTPGTDASDGATGPPDAGSRPAARSREDAAAVAWRNTLVVFPIVAVYFIFGYTSVLVLVFVALLSMQPNFTTGVKAGKALIAGNVMGGVAAVLGYELLVMVPQFAFLLALVLLAGLVLGGRLFSDAPTAPLFGMAFSTMLLIVGSTTSLFGDANSKAWTRVLQITLAVVYLVLAFGLVERLRRGEKTADATT